MRQKLVISACSSLLPEIAQVIQDGDYSDVKVSGFNANCTNNYLSTERINNIISREKEIGSNYIFIGGVCHGNKEPKPNDEKIDRVKLQLCFEIFLNREIVSHYVSKGYYLVTNGWLFNLEKHIKNWGFDKETANLFFRESTKGILLLDTQIPGDYLPNLKKLSEYMGVPYKVIPIGLSHCKQYIDSLVLKWRYETNRKMLNESISSASKIRSDYSVILAQLKILITLNNEPDIVEVGFNLINMLFAPSGIKYISYNERTEEYFQFGNPTKITHHSFKIEVIYSNEILGVFEIQNIQFPQYINQYEEMGRLISKIFGLATANARKYKVTLKQKQQLEMYSIDLQKINQSKDKFFSIIAHDLKSPFNSLIRISEYLVEAINANEMKSIETGAQLINQVSNNTYRLLINLLEWAQTQTGTITFKPERINLSNILNETIELQKVHANTKTISILNIVNKNTSVVADKNMLKTVVRNLISNAIKYTQTNGEILVSASIEENQTRVSVSDDGVGIPQKSIGKLFKLENTISAAGTNNETGTGLGLILSKEYIDLHNGKIWVDSEEGKGSVFHFSLPNQTALNMN